MQQKQHLVAFFTLMASLWPSAVWAHPGHSGHTVPPYSIGLYIILFIFSLIIASSLKQWPKHKIITVLSLGSLIFLSFAPQTLAASITVLGPNGECLEGGAQTTITWTGSGNDHYALYFRNNNSTPNYNDDSSGLIAHPAYDTEQNWTIPSITTTTAKIWVEGHDSVHSPTGINSATVAIDNSVPSAPSLSLQSKTATSITLSWSAATDSGCQQLEGYKVFRAGSVVATLGSNVTSYTDSGLTANTAYAYKVQAFDSFAATDSTTNTVTTDSNTSQPTPTPATATPTPNASAKTTTKATAKPTSPPSAIPSPSPSSSASPSPTAPANLELVSIDGKKQSIPSSGELQVDHGKIIHLAGTTLPNASLVLTIHSTPTPVTITANSESKWEYDINTALLEVGSHRVTIAAKDAATGTPETELLKFSLATITHVKPNKQSPTLPLYLIAGGITFFTLLLAGYFIYRSNHKQPLPAPPLPLQTPTPVSKSSPTSGVTVEDSIPPPPPPIT
jgi:hypothetical protein